MPRQGREFGVSPFAGHHQRASGKPASFVRLAKPGISFIILSCSICCVLGDKGMKCLIVYYMNGHWVGEEVSWKRSGSGSYRETSRIEIPQSKAQIEIFAAENRYVVEWRGKIPAETPAAASA
jgi:hypothetical protein